MEFKKAEGFVYLAPGPLEGIFGKLRGGSGGLYSDIPRGSVFFPHKQGCEEEEKLLKYLRQNNGSKGNGEQLEDNGGERTGKQSGNNGNKIPPSYLLIYSNSEECRQLEGYGAKIVDGGRMKESTGRNFDSRIQRIFEGYIVPKAYLEAYFNRPLPEVQVEAAPEQKIIPAKQEERFYDVGSTKARRGGFRREKLQRPEKTKRPYTLEREIAPAGDELFFNVDELKGWLKRLGKTELLETICKNTDKDLSISYQQVSKNGRGSDHDVKYIHSSISKSYFYQLCKLAEREGIEMNERPYYNSFKFETEINAAGRSVIDGYARKWGILA